MKSRHNNIFNRNGALWLLFLIALLVKADSSQVIPDFTFIHASDIHAPMPQSQATLARIRDLGEINLAPFNITAPRPGFAIITGDLNEFGGGSGWWETYLSYAKGIGLPAYPVLGNHDVTWHANIKPMRDAGFHSYYSFDQKGCHFVGLMTATPQDPRPSLSEEEIQWLKKDLEKAGNQIPVFAFFHHPLGGTEFASRYDWDRLLDILRQYNTVLLLAGHSHGHTYRPVDGFDQVTGGSTFGTNAGFSVISVQKGVVRAAYWKTNQPAPYKKLIEKTLTQHPAYPKIQIISPAFRNASSDILKISARLSGLSGLEKAIWSVDDKATGGLDLTGQDGDWTASGKADIGQLLPGAHYLRVDFLKATNHFTRSTQFFLSLTNSPKAWHAYLEASSKSTPAIENDRIYVGANDGKLRAFNAKTGQELWAADTGAEILAEPLIHDSMIFVANGLGIVTAYLRTGEKIWAFQAGDAVYSSPIFAEGNVVFGCNDGKLYALEAATGKTAWINSDATYAIESKPFAWNHKIYYGAWDEYVRCVDATNGKLIWKQISEGVRSTKAAKRFYSPADAMPVVADGKLMIADRNYVLSIFDAENGSLIGSRPKVAALGLSEDGKFAYLRQTDGLLVKIDASTNEIWSVKAQLNAIPAAPIEKNGVVYVCSDKGTVSAISSDKGKILWQYQASPQLYVMSAVACDGAIACVTAFDGTLTAIAIPSGIKYIDKK